MQAFYCIKIYIVIYNLVNSIATLLAFMSSLKFMFLKYAQLCRLKVLSVEIYLLFLAVKCWLPMSWFLVENIVLLQLQSMPAVTFIKLYIFMCLWCIIQPCQVCAFNKVDV